MSLTHLPEPWRPNAVYKVGDRVTLRDERAIFVLRCEKAGKGGLRPPRLPVAMSTMTGLAETLLETTIVKAWDVECEWWLERVVRRAYAPRK